jgi:cytoskeletal protein CcmA (bactofilin family)
MVWRRKKRQLAGSAGEPQQPVGDHVVPEAGRVAGTVNADVAEIKILRSSHLAVAPQDQGCCGSSGDGGAWQAGAPEFSLPVSHAASRRPYIIPRNYRISGNLSTARQVVVNGEFVAGVLDAPTVTVAPGGRARGRIAANNVQIAGTVDAEVTARTAVEVSGRGHLAGEVRAPAVKVWPGAVLHVSSLNVGQTEAKNS